MNGIQYLHDSLTTTIMHTLCVLLNDTLTAKNLALFLDLNLFIEPNAFSILLETALLSFREWKNFATVAINDCKLELDTIQNKSKELRIAFITIIIEHNSEVLDNLTELIKLIFIKHLVRYLNSKSHYIKYSVKIEIAIMARVTSSQTSRIANLLFLLQFKLTLTCVS
jgi:hypothetical protein